MDKIRIGISTCLLGENVRYDGGHQLDRYLTQTLGRYFDYAPVCPEVEYGLPIPREALRLVGDPAEPRLVTIRTGVDHTDGMKAWAKARLEDIAAENLGGFIFKSRSPSSGMAAVKVYGSSGQPVKTGVGIFARAFMERFPLLPVEEDGRLHDPVLRENFIERVFAYQRWKDMVRSDGGKRGIVDFHTAHKLLILSHSPRHLTELGRIAAALDRVPVVQAQDRYLRVFMDGLRLIATTKKQTNVLQHMAGYFKKQMTGDEKAELQEVIGQYHQGLLPLIVPVTLLQHYVRRFAEPYLQGQIYLHPHPMELMLRNHA